MPAKAFISYSHNDEKMLTALHKHHAVMKREKTISTWYDRDILAGGRVHGDIVDALTSSELFLALVSPDYVNSTYCYDKEFQQALSRNSAGTMQIVPIVIEPCEASMSFPTAEGRSGLQGKGNVLLDSAFAFAPGISRCNFMRNIAYSCNAK